MKNFTFLKRKLIKVFLAASLIFIPLKNNFAQFFPNGTYVYRDVNGCTVRIVLQIAIRSDNEAADALAVRNALQNCFNFQVNCNIPCQGPSPRNCAISITVDVKPSGDIPPFDLRKFHIIDMGNGGRTFVTPLGVPNGRNAGGFWERGLNGNIYCHEALHLCGLDDKYCAREFIGNEIKVIRKCDAAEPDNGCCNSQNGKLRKCFEPCPGSQNDIMGNTGAMITCANIRAILTNLPALNTCPAQPCCDDPLPVEMSTFTSSVIGNDVFLDWTTVSETNNAGFYIERKNFSRNEQWESVGFISGNGTSQEAENYSFRDSDLGSGRYSYRLKQIDVNGNFHFYELNEDVIIGIPDNFNLYQNYPNPFNPVTKINFDIPEDEFVTLKIIDNAGRVVQTVLSEYKTAGYHSVEFSAEGKLSSGVYFYKLEAGKFSAVRKMAVVK